MKRWHLYLCLINHLLSENLSALTLQSLIDGRVGREKLIELLIFIIVLIKRMWSIGTLMLKKCRLQKFKIWLWSKKKALNNRLRQCNKVLTMSLIVGVWYRWHLRCWARYKNRLREVNESLIRRLLGFGKAHQFSKIVMSRLNSSKVTAVKCISKGVMKSQKTSHHRKCKVQTRVVQLRIYSGNAKIN